MIWQLLRLRRQGDRTCSNSAGLTYQNATTVTHETPKIELTKPSQKAIQNKEGITYADSYAVHE